MGENNNQLNTQSIKGKYILLRYLDNTREGDRLPNYFAYTYNLDTTKCIAEFWENNLIEYAPIKTALSHLTGQKLKDILSSHQLSTTGKKDIMIERIVDNINETDIQPHLDKYIVVTEKGKVLISKYVTEWDYENRYDNFYLIPNYEAVVEGIMNSNYTAIEFDRSVAPRGEFKIAACKKFFDEYELPAMVKAIIISKFLDNSRSDTIKKSLIYYLDYDIDLADISRATALLRSYSELLSIQKTNHKFIYLIQSSKDKAACEYCKSMEGKTFDISEAVVGENYPPFKQCTCDFCRCYASHDLKDI